MSKYIDLELALNELLRLYEEDVDMYGVEIPETFDYHRARETMQNLPTIEVSEDCISREFLITSLEYCRAQRHLSVPDWWVYKSDLLKMIMNAPSVVPSKQEPQMRESGSNDIEKTENADIRPIDDCISRANVLMYIADVQLTVSGEKKPTMSLRDLCEWMFGGIKEMPSVVPKQKQVPKMPNTKPPKERGKWIWYEDDGHSECSLCGCELWLNDIFVGAGNYCPNCGARMKSERGEE